MKDGLLRQLRGCGAVLMVLAGLAGAVSAQTVAGSNVSAKPTVASNASATSAPRSALLVFPFENSGRDPQMDWLGEGLAELAMERLAGHAPGNGSGESAGNGPIVFSREERLAALEKLGLPAYSGFTRATMLKIAGEIDADYVLFGEFTPDGRTLHVSARVMSVNPPKLFEPITESGALDSLAEIQARLSWQVICRIHNAQNTDMQCESSSQAAQQFIGMAARVRPDALEYFVRGLLSSEEEARLRDLREASRLEPEWDEPLFSIGQTYYARRDCESALGWFARVPVSSVHAGEAGFDTGVCQLQRNDPVHAESTFAAMQAGSNSGASEPPGILSNLGTALLREARYKEAAADFERAEQIDPGEPDYWFNLGLADYLLSNWAESSRALGEVVRLQPDSSEARALLAAALDRNGNGDEANALRQGASSGTGKDEPKETNPRKQDVTKMNATALARLARIRVGLNTGAPR
jgi:tetratricopeptide (TPR) repeat protein